MHSISWYHSIIEAYADPQVTGSISISLEDVEIVIADKFVFTGNAVGKIDFDKKTVSADVSFANKIDGKEYILAEFSIEVDKDTKASDDIITIKSLIIEGISYDPESVLTYIKNAEKKDKAK